MSRSKQEETNKTSFTIFGYIYIYISMIFANSNTHKYNNYCYKLLLFIFYPHRITHAARRRGSPLPPAASRGGTARAERGPGWGGAHPKLRRRNGATGRRHSEQRRWRVEVLVEKPVQEGKRMDEHPNRRRAAVGRCSHEESKRGSPWAANRRRQRSSSRQLPMAAGRCGIDSG